MRELLPMILAVYWGCGMSFGGVVLNIARGRASSILHDDFTLLLAGPINLSLLICLYFLWRKPWITNSLAGDDAEMPVSYSPSRLCVLNNRFGALLFSIAWITGLVMRLAGLFDYENRM